MARPGHRTVPLHSKVGVLATLEQQEPHLIEAEWRGRVWAHAQARHRRTFTDVAMLELHGAMFGPLLDWAGHTRSQEVGAGGLVYVPFARVREELRTLTDDFATRLVSLGKDPALEDLACLLADAHHRFQWIHPFFDANGRTGRVLDHFVLWSCFGLATASMETSPVIPYFAKEGLREEYDDALLEAHLRRPERLRAYYIGRLEKAFAPVFTVHRQEAEHASICVAIHEDVDAAIADARSRSTSDPRHAYRVLGEGGNAVARATGGHLVNDPDL